MKPINKRKKRNAPENKKPKPGPRRFTRFAKGAAKISAVGVFMSALFFGGRLGLAHAMELNYFSVKKVTVTGKRSVGEKKIMDMIGPALEINIFELNLEEIGERIEAHPWIREVEVRRELPHDLTVRLKERKPVAYVRLSGNGLWLMDDQGVLLDKINKDEDAGMITFTGLKIDGRKLKAGYEIGVDKIKSALDAARRLKGYMLFGKNRIHRIDLKDPEKLRVFFEGSEIALITPRSGWTDEIERLKVVDYIFRKKAGDIKSIDLTFVDKVIVTYPEA
ncbi:hypothetical protein MNBD_NITROSPINAE02-959 [hydrothermal vent metagenome]|uniref:POTRA domain-containing protein n=1 Tax=hydrothermal vent metagenome TaxID=652676 RepID=A0A3B1CAF3_9ZZZZ